MISAHVWFQAYTRNTAAQTPGQQVRYLQRTGEFDPVHYLKREGIRTKDYRDYVIGDTQNLPTWAKDDPGKFFSAAECWEGANRQYAYQVEFSLPRGLTHAQHMAIRQDFMGAVMPDLPALWVKHEKVLESGELHPHIHILFSARKQDGLDRDEQQTFRRWNREHPERGGCEKDRFWNQRQAAEQLREAFAAITNYHLEIAHAIERVDPRAFKRREIWRKAVRYGNQDERTATTQAAELAKATLAWEQRKAYKQLGAVQDIPREEFVLLVRQWTREYERGKALPRVSQEQWLAWAERDRAQARAEARCLEHQRDRAHAAVMIAEHRGRQAHGWQREEVEVDLDKRWGQPLIGNKKSLIYHTPEHKNYGDVAPPNQVMFWTEREAQDAGYRRAVNDHYGRGSGQVMEATPRGTREGRTPGQEGCARDTRQGTRRTQDPPGVGMATRPTTAPLAGIVRDEDTGGGLQGPDLRHKRDRDRGRGYEYD